MKRRLVFGVLVLSIIALFVFAKSRHNPKTYPIQGIDVSHHQGAINWNAVAGSDIAFAYMKATEGGDWEDPRFQENWAAAKKLGVPVGAYHYFSTCRAGRKQADNFISTVPFSDQSLPPALDLEYGGFCGAPPSRESLLLEVQDWIARVEAATGTSVVIYTTKDFHDAFLDGALKEQPFWLRSLGRQPNYSDRDWVMWQYWNRGTVDGINGPVDLNAFHGDLNDFRSFAQRKRD